MNRLNRKSLALVALALVLLVMTPGTALAADMGSTIFQRFWDSLVQTASGRIKSDAPAMGRTLQEAEKVFFGYTEDVTRHAAVRDVVAGMQYIGLFLLAWCFVLSLSDLTTASLVGGNPNVGSWFWRFFVATFMTFAGTEVYSLIIRLFNFLISNLREFLDKRWTPASTGNLYAQLVQINAPDLQPLLLVGFAAMFMLVCIVLWFLIGGVRPAELTVFTLLAPLTWPLYMLPGYDDIPKTAFRGFMGVNAVLLLVVGMSRVAIRWVVGGAQAGNYWNWIPAISLLGMCVFLPAVVKRIVGQGHAGLSPLMTAARLALGVKLLSTVGVIGGGQAVAPPAIGATPATATAPSPHSMAAPPPPPPMPVHAGGVPATAGQPMPTYYRYCDPPVPRLESARVQAAPPALADPTVRPKPHDILIDSYIDPCTQTWVNRVREWSGPESLPRPATPADGRTGKED